MTYECYWCHWNFRDYSTLRRHLEKAHPKQYAIYCRTRQITGDTSWYKVDLRKFGIDEKHGSTS